MNPASLGVAMAAVGDGNRIVCDEALTLVDVDIEGGRFWLPGEGTDMGYACGGRRGRRYATEKERRVKTRRGAVGLDAGLIDCSHLSPRANASCQKGKNKKDRMDERKSLPKPDAMVDVLVPALVKSIIRIGDIQRQRQLH